MLHLSLSKVRMQCAAPSHTPGGWPWVVCGKPTVWALALPSTVGRAEGSTPGYGHWHAQILQQNSPEFSSTRLLYTHPQSTCFGP